MIIGQELSESETVFCTWHGIKGTNVYLDSTTGTYGITQNNLVVATRETLAEIAKLYVHLTWGHPKESETTTI